MSTTIEPSEALRALREEAIALSREARRLEQAALHLEQAVHGFVRAQQDDRCPDARPMLSAVGQVSGCLQGVQGAWAGIEDALGGLRFALDTGSVPVCPRGACGGHRLRWRLRPQPPRQGPVDPS